MNRKASAVWTGDFKSGKGNVTTSSGALKDAAYSFGARFESSPGTNPEELIAAAHAACFTMAFSNELGKLKVAPERIDTTATVTLAMRAEGWSITAIDLNSQIRAPGADAALVEQAANTAKENCPVSRLLKAPIHLEARLVSGNQQTKKAG